MRKLSFLIIFSILACGASNNKSTLKEDIDINKTVTQEVSDDFNEKKLENKSLTQKDNNEPSVKVVEKETQIEQKEPKKLSSQKKMMASPQEKDKRDLLADEAGEIVYAEGDRILYRDGKVIFEVDSGLGIESYDTIRTGDNGLVEAELRSPLVPESLITINENTSFTFTLNLEESNKKSILELTTGYIEVVAENLAGDEELEVRTGSSSLGVRGTSFSVTAVPSGDVLITCVEGRVECSDGDLRINAIPGQVVEKSTSSPIIAKKVPVSKIEAYRENWHTEKIRLLRENALVQIKKNVSEYEKRLNEFKNAYNNLMSEKSILNKWVKEDKSNTQGSMIEVLKEKKAIIGHLQDIQKALFWFETVYIRLIKIKKYHDQGYGKGEISPGYSTTDFFMEMESQGLDDKLADIKYIFKLYAKRNDGSVPVGGISDPFDFGNDDIFNF